MANPTFLGLDYSTPLTINSKERVSRSETLNLKIQAVSNGSQRWECIITLAPSNNKGTVAANHHGARLAVHRVKYGIHASFNDAPMPQYIGTEPFFATGEAPITSSTEFSPVVSSDVSVNRIGTTKVKMKASARSTLPAGRFFTFSNHTKVYQVAADDGNIIVAGQEVLISPALLKDVNNASITINAVDPVLTAYYNANGIEGVSYVGGIMTAATIDLIENVAI